MITVRSQFNEKLEWIVSGEDLEEQVFRARTVANMDPIFPQLIRMACIDAERIIGLPEGMPDTIRLENDLPVGIADSTLRQEIRRIKNFQFGKSMQMLSKVKREAAWIELLEAVHPAEAKSLTAIKDWTLFSQYPALFDIMETLTGNPVDVPRGASALPKEEVLPPVTDGPSEETVSEQTEPASVQKKRGRAKKSDGGNES